MLIPNMPILIPFSEILARFFRVKVPRASFCVKIAYNCATIGSFLCRIRFFCTFSIIETDLQHVGDSQLMLRLNMRLFSFRKWPEVTGNDQKRPEMAEIT